MTNRYPVVGDRIVAWVRPLNARYSKAERGVLTAVGLHDWCDILLDSGELIEGEYHIKELTLEAAFDAAEVPHR